MVLLIPDKKCLVLQHKNFFVSSKKHSRLSSGTSGTLCKQSSPFTMWRLSQWGSDVHGTTTGCNGGVENSDCL